jgi:cell wall-associated NlpC family hydrolase
MDWGDSMRMNAKRVRRTSAALLLLAGVVAVPARADSDSSGTPVTDTPEDPLLLGAGADASATSTGPLLLESATSTAPKAADSVTVAIDAAAHAELSQSRAAADGRSTRAKAIRAQIVALAKAQVGDRYVAGATGPDAFDCSGLVRYVYRTVTGRELPHYSKSQFKAMTRVHLVDAKPGDLVFFFRGHSHHVGIYIGDGKMVDAAGARKGVRIDPIRGSWWGRNYTGIGRVLAG